MTSLTEQTPSTSTSAVVVERVRSRIDDLRLPCTTDARQWVTEPGVDHLVRRVVTVTIPPLIEQLALSMAGSTSGRGSSGTKSRPPGSLEGTDALRTITFEARYLAGRILARLAVGAVPGLQLSVRPRRLVDALAVIHTYIAEQDRTSLLDVDRAVTRWWSHARVATTWETPPLRPWVPCPSCRRRGGIRVIDAPLVMVCLDCGAAWDGSTAAELEAVYRLAFAEPIEMPRVDVLPDRQHEG